MNNPFIYSNSNKRYHTINYYYEKKYNSKVFKVEIDLGLTCPNIDGKCGFGGCIYCLNRTNHNDILEQFKINKEIMLKKWPQAKYIGYFNNHSNTYGDFNYIKSNIELVLKQNVIGISIATRPDCLNDEWYNYLEELNKKTFLIIELGLQTIHNKTAKLINRCHSLSCFKNSVKQLQKRHIHVVVHIINGLPYETKEMMLETAKYLNDLRIDGLKIHMLFIMKNTKLANLYYKNPFPLLTRDEYVNIVCEQLQLLNPNIIIHRITGDPPKEDLIAPNWVLKKFCVLNEIDKELAKRNSYQGKNII